MLINDVFIKDPLKAFKKWAIAVPENIPHGNQLVSIESINDHTCIIKQPGTLNAMCLMPRKDMKNEMLLPNNADFFFTPELSGCQIVIYRDSHGIVNVEHHNSKSDILKYGEWLQNIKNRYPNAISVSCGTDYNVENGFSVFGYRTSYGWTFWGKNYEGNTLCGPWTFN